MNFRNRSTNISNNKSLSHNIHSNWRWWGLIRPQQMRRDIPSHIALYRMYYGDFSEKLLNLIPPTRVQFSVILCVLKGLVLFDGLAMSTNETPFEHANLLSFDLGSLTRHEDATCGQAGWTWLGQNLFQHCTGFLRVRISICMTSDGVKSFVMYRQQKIQKHGP